MASFGDKEAETRPLPQAMEEEPESCDMGLTFPSLSLLSSLERSHEGVVVVSAAILVLAMTLTSEEFEDI